MSERIPITVAAGDGIGPEIMAATLRVLEAAGVPLEFEHIKIGEEVYKAGHITGIEPNSWDSLRRTKVFLKAPITTPQGGGYASLNVAVRKTLGLYANVRPCVTYPPFVDTKFPEMDVVIIRENEEDTYAGIEHQQTDQVTQCLKLISRPGCERICRYAFEYAVANDRKKVTCFTKDNIMKLTDGLFHKVFDEIAAQYPSIENEHWIVDIGAAKMATAPENFDVIVMPNLYGDILSDVAAQMTGSVGMAGSANIGEGIAMFEAIHGSAPRRAGQNLANPSGLLNGAIMMLVHLGLPEDAERIHNAWLATIEDGIHTYDVYKPELSRDKVGTKEFAEAIVERLGRTPERLKAASYRKDKREGVQVKVTPTQPAKKDLVGVDVFIHNLGIKPEQLGQKLTELSGDGLQIQIVANRGVQVWPEGFPETFCSDHWRCRFMGSDGNTVTHQQVVSLLNRIAQAGLDFIKTENLCNFDGKRAYST